MSKYTTGELAKSCNVSVRTVQFYDTKGLLPPSELTDGGRRLYTENDLIKLRLICMLKSLGLSLDSIQGILESEAPAKVLNLLLDEQAKRISGEIEECQKQIAAIKIVKDSIKNMDAIPVNSIQDIGHMMENRKKLRKLHATCIGIGVPFQLMFNGSIVLWIMKGLWIPFVVITPIYALVCVLIVKALHQKTRYICPECNATFHPLLRNTMRTSGWKVRWLTCTECGHEGYCVEVYAGS